MLHQCVSIMHCSLTSALHCRDVLNVLGMYPGDPGPPGGDCAGVVVATGPPLPGHPELAVGTPVFGLAAGSLGSHVHSSTKTIVQLPANLSFEAAATMPTVFVTVDAALRHAAATQAGDRVLVHAAAGGVGLAAVQVIQAAGAQALASAGSPAKRALLRNLGVAHLGSSRDCSFAEGFAQLGGADVVLNTLTSPGMVSGSLAALNIGGRFVEISKRDIWSAARVAQGECQWRAHCWPLQYYLCDMHSMRPPQNMSPLQSDTMLHTRWLPSTSCQLMHCTQH